MKSLNLGILAHVDAGKTSLTERLLYTAGAIDAIGSVDAGNTQTDSLKLEQQRGITIKSAVVSFVVNDVRINLIDTPGHPDFIAEVERVLDVLDGVVLVISAVEGVQPQTRVLMRALKRLKIPTLLFVNKIDRGGAQYERTLAAITEKLTPAVIAMGSVKDIGSRGASFVAHQDDDNFASQLTELLSNNDEAILKAYTEGQSVAYDQLHRSLARQTKQALVHPIFFGSAITGAGVDVLIDGITGLLPTAASNPNDELAGSIFKIERGESGEKVAFARLFSGAIRVRQDVRFGNGKSGKVTAIKVFDSGSTDSTSTLVAGRIGKLWGLHNAQVGDIIGALDTKPKHHFAPPTLEAVVAPRTIGSKGALHAALLQLAEQDPLINLRQDDTRQEIYVSLYGEVQKEVIQSTLASDFGLDVDFLETKTICVERPVATGAALEIGKRGDPFLATVGLRVEPRPDESGIKYHVAQDALGKMPAAFYKAVEDTVHATLTQGLYGWQVVDCLVTLTDVDFFPRQSHAHARFDKSMSSTGADFRGLTPLVLLAALKQASTKVYEPIHQFELEIPSTSLSALLPVLAKLNAVTQNTTAHGDSYILEGDIPAGQIHDLQQQLPGLTGGEGVLESHFERYDLVHGELPTRPRSDFNPLNRREYLLRIAKRA